MEQDKYKLPNFLTKVTPFSKALALFMLIAFPILGFKFGIWYQKQIYSTTPSTNTLAINQISSIPTSTPTLTPQTIKSPDCDPELLCIDGRVYLVDQKGQKTLISQEVVDPNNPVNENSIRYASLSPSKKFIAIGKVQWEGVYLDIYEIKSQKTYPATATGHEFGEWLSDDRLIVFGECGMGIDCGIFVSRNNQQPWNMLKAFSAPLSWTK